MLASKLPRRIPGRIGTLDKMNIQGIVPYKKMKKREKRKR